MDNHRSLSQAFDDLTLAERANSFFARFPIFALNSTALIEDEFERLAKEQGWARNSTAYRRNRNRCLIEEFVARFGTVGGASKLEKWQELCDEVGMEDAPNSITQCKKALNSVNVNLVDLINARRAGESVKCFRTRKELVAYTRKTPGKIFPKELAKQDGFIRALLVQLY
ncbi:hypothetical protein B0A49_02051 [Cryomyces minteri]|uniref:Uncharacterized protein n=1 Tax=Cryomyces minteri TaxID=331657 RepID=A0A4U0XTH3_9PEZI|nr:hypothetical protein B0A49_02051 [Cryomyces minteri]